MMSKPDGSRPRMKRAELKSGHKVEGLRGRLLTCWITHAPKLAPVCAGTAVSLHSK